jgi:hypothetical protein
MDHTSQPKETAKMGELKTKIIDIITAIQKKEHEVCSMKGRKVDLEKELQAECENNGHNFINEREGGAYGDTYTYCSICNLLR